MRKDAALQCEAEAEGSLPEELEGLTINDSYASLVGDLMQFLRQEKVELRQNLERFSHAKCYIFEDLAVVGPLVSKEPLGQSKFIVTWKPYELTEDGSLFSGPQSHYRSQ